MRAIDNIHDKFAAFSDYLRRDRTTDTAQIAKLQNGFEGWLKLEFYFWLIRECKLRPATETDTNGDIGLEYGVSLDGRTCKETRLTKQCDLWVRATKLPTYHYVELKAPFAKWNKRKVLTSAGYDFWYMSRLRHRYEQVATGNAIVLGVGFSEESWKEGILLVQKSAGIPEDVETVKEGFIDRNRTVRWCILTRQYT